MIPIPSYMWNHTGKFNSVFDLEGDKDQTVDDFRKNSYERMERTLDWERVHIERSLEIIDRITIQPGGCDYISANANFFSIFDSSRNGKEYM